MKFPPVEPCKDIWGEGRSERVLVRLDNSAEFWFGRYSYLSKRWYVEGISGDEPEVVEWWPLPTGKGEPVLR